MILSLFLSILASFIISFPQEGYQIEKELNLKAEYLKVDKLGHIYTVNGTEVQRIEVNTNRKKSYSNILSGQINSIDVSDPFRVLLFYKDFNKIEWLDKNLSPIGSPISLDELGYYQVAAVCQSVNGGFWLFDQSLNQVIYVDKNLNTVNKSAQLLEMIGQNAEFKQVYMLEKNDYIYLGINGSYILLFDSYGTYIKSFPLKYIKEFQVYNETIIYNRNNELFFYDTTNYTEERITLPIEKNEQVIIVNKKLYLKTAEKVLIYKANNF